MEKTVRDKASAAAARATARLLLSQLYQISVDAANQPPELASATQTGNIGRQAAAFSASMLERLAHKTAEPICDIARPVA
jgi:hypothetical protein